ncbi:hypothetical protein FSPOR_3421 [Fusarium sporotrichioides]|uniref:HNH nuclease domain-containing protein n=1 Tax=Fusarium sporotrichioides TaxID=5514 RepID=A0A395SFX2_FUSSP|nr:hypothetical protein FSPOR_3421 [Fusarium sporotrichioides]
MAQSFGVPILEPEYKEGTRSQSIIRPAVPLRADALFPIACLQEPELDKRYGQAKKIEVAIKDIYPWFSFRVEQLAVILLVGIEDLRGSGHLSPTTCSPYHLKDRVCDVSPFYMLQLDPRNLDQKHWGHVISKAPKWQPRLDIEMHPDQVALSIYYNSRFRTGKSVENLPPGFHKEAESKCRERDKKRCVVTGRDNPRIFWFIPRGWNDTVEHNNTTGNLEGGCIFLTKIDLLDDIHSATELGKTHEAWNMLCVDPAIYNALTQGLCAFSFIRKKDVDDRTSEVHLKFFWMPILRGRFDQIVNLNEVEGCFPIKRGNKPVTFDHERVEREGKEELSLDLSMFQHRGCPMPRQVDSERTAISDPPILSGKDVVIKMPKRESELFETVVRIHWACVTFAALCGGAGRAWYLTGKKQVDGSFEPRDEQFRRDGARKNEHG